MSTTTDEPIHRISFGDGFRYMLRAIGLVWKSSRRIPTILAILTVIVGVLPALIAIFGKHIVNGVLAAADSGLDADKTNAIMWVIITGVVFAALLVARGAQNLCKSLLYARLGYDVSLTILDKALKLDLPHLENAQCQDQMMKAKREATSRPFSLVNRAFLLLQNIVLLGAVLGLILQFSPLAALFIALAALPAFIVEARLSGAVFRFYQTKTPEMRERSYLESLMTREAFAKEVRHFKLEKPFRERYKKLFMKLFWQDRKLQVRRAGWGMALTVFSTSAFYGAYVWTAVVTINGLITLGEMTMYMALFRQGQNAFGALLHAIGGMYEDTLYVSNLFEYLAIEEEEHTGTATAGPDPQAGIQFEDVVFTYPEAQKAAINGLTMQIRPGTRVGLVGPNGSGKTTIIKLLLRLYKPDSGKILVDGLDLSDWDIDALRERTGIIFQGFQRYKLTVRDNIGAGDRLIADDELRLMRAARLGMATELIEQLEKGLNTRLGKRYKGSRELSGGEWQRIALSRAFMREDADILILDEPSSALDAEGEHQIFSQIGKVARHRIAILISHRLANLTDCDSIIVLHRGRLVEQGTHQQLLEENGRYARIFGLQAKAYQDGAQNLPKDIRGAA